MEDMNNEKSMDISMQDTFTYSVDGVNEVQDVENAITEVTSEEIENSELFAAKTYDSFLVLQKKDLSEFIGVVESWAKITTYNYGQCVRFHSLSAEEVSVQYVNSPTFLERRIVNKSGKIMPDFYVRIEVLRGILHESREVVVFVYENDDVNFVFLNELLYVETLNLLEDEYEFSKEGEGEKVSVDLDIAQFVFGDLAFAFDLSEWGAGKVLIVDGDKVRMNMRGFLAEMKSPFGRELHVVMHKMVVESLADLLQMCRNTFSVSFSADMETMYVNVDKDWYGVFQVISDVSKFWSPKYMSLLDFKSNVEIVNDSILRLAQVASRFDYLTSVIGLTLERDMLKVKMFSMDLVKTIEYKLQVKVDEILPVIDIKVGSVFLTSYLKLVGKAAKYSFTEAGIGLQTDMGKFLLFRQG